MDYPKKVIETLPEEKTNEEDGTREIEKNPPKNEKQMSVLSITSAIKQKRKSESIVKSEIKRTRSEDYEQKVECENKNVMYGSSVQSAASTDSQMEKCEKSLASAAEFSGNIKEETIKEQKNVKSPDKIVLKEENVEIANETGSTRQAPIKVRETVIFQSKCADNESNLLDAKLPRQEILNRDHFRPFCAKKIKPTNLDSATASSSAVVQTSSMDFKRISDVGLENSQIKLDSTDNYNERRNTISLQTECKPSKLKSDSSFDQPKSCVPKIDEKLSVENKNVDSVSEREASSREIENSYSVSLQMKKNAAEMNKMEISNSSNSESIKSEIELLEQKVGILSDLLDREAFDASLNNLKNLSDIAEFDQGDHVYKELEFATSGLLPLDEEFIQTQRAILESHSQQRHSEENVKFESQIEDEKTILPVEDYSSDGSSCVPDKIITDLQMNLALKSAVKLLQQNNEETAERLEGLALRIENNLNSLYYQMSRTKIEKTSSTISIKANEKSEQEKPEKNDKTVNPGVLTAKPRPPVILLSTGNSKFPITSPSTENPKSPVISPTTENRESPVSPISSPKKQEDNSSKTDDSGIICREYPGIAEEPTKVKKDARYQKKFYKQKPVRLPINMRIEIEPETEVDHDKDPQTQRVGDDPPSCSRDREDDKPIIISEKKPSCEKDLPSTLESNVQDTDRYKESSFREETPSTTDSGEESDELQSNALKKKFPK